MLTNEAFRRKHADGSVPLVTLSFTEALLVLSFVLFCLVMIGTNRGLSSFITQLTQL